MSPDTLIVWTEADGTDIALSFADPDDCENIWDFVIEVQRMLEAPSSSSTSLAASASLRQTD